MKIHEDNTEKTGRIEKDGIVPGQIRQACKQTCKQKRRCGAVFPKKVIHGEERKEDRDHIGSDAVGIVKKSKCGDSKNSCQNSFPCPEKAAHDKKHHPDDSSCSQDIQNENGTEVFTEHYPEETEKNIVKRALESEIIERDIPGEELHGVENIIAIEIGLDLIPTDPVIPERQMKHGGCINHNNKSDGKIGPDRITGQSRKRDDFVFGERNCMNVF